MAILEGVGAHWGSFNQGSAASVPAAAAQTSGSDPIAQLLASIPQVTKDDVQAANAPLVGGHAEQLPSNMTTPIQPYQQTPYNHNPVVGAGNARARGIGNAITAVMNGLGNVVTAEAQNKQNQIRDSATKVIEAQHSIDQAQQQLEVAKQSGDTATALKMQDFITQQTKIRDQIFADPKMRKALAKGFNINYTDPTQNKTLEHAGVQEAIKNAKTRQEKIAAIRAYKQQQQQAAGSAAGSAYASEQPRELVPNVAAQQQLQMKLQARKDTIDSLKALAPVESARIKAGGDFSTAQLKGDIELRVAAITGQRAVDVQTLKNKQHNIDNDAALQQIRLKGSMDIATKTADSGNPDNIMKSFEAAADDYQKSLATIQKNRQALNAELDNKFLSAGRRIEIRRQLSDLDNQQTTAQNAFTALRNYCAKRAGLDVSQLQINVPTVHVGDGVDNAKSTGKSNTDSPDLDPRTGKPWKSGVPIADRALIKLHHEAGELRGTAERKLNDLNKNVQVIKTLFSGDSNKTD